MQKLFVIMILACSIQSSVAQDGISKANRVGAPVKVDGLATEWDQPLRFYDGDTKLFYSFLNDSNNLYICFEAPDEANQMKILCAGMKVSLSIKGKDKHKVSIVYPMQQNAASSEGGNNEHSQKFDRANIKNTFLVQNTMMEVKGFTGKDGVIPINDASGINAAMNWDSTGKLFYEIAIPFKEFFGDDEGAFTKEISMEAAVNAVQRQSHANSGTGNGGEFHGGGGGRMGGGGGHMNGGGRQRNGADNNADGTTNADRSALFTKSTLKQKFILATK